MDAFLSAVVAGLAIRFAAVVPSSQFSRKDWASLHDALIAVALVEQGRLKKNGLTKVHSIANDLMPLPVDNRHEPFEVTMARADAGSAREFLAKADLIINWHEEQVISKDAFLRLVADPLSIDSHPAITASNAAAA